MYEVRTLDRDKRKTLPDGGQTLTPITMLQLTHLYSIF